MEHNKEDYIDVWGIFSYFMRHASEPYVLVTKTSFVSFDDEDV